MKKFGANQPFFTEFCSARQSVSKCAAERERRHHIAPSSAKTSTAAPMLAAHTAQLVGAALGRGASTCAPDAGFDDAFEDGFVEGFVEGFAEEFVEGFVEGWGAAPQRAESVQTSGEAQTLILSQGLYVHTLSR